VILAAYALTLSKIARQDHVVIGSPVAGRSASMTDQLIGFFANTMVLPVQIHPGDSIKDLIEQTKKLVEKCIGRPGSAV